MPPRVVEAPDVDAVDCNLVEQPEDNRLGCGIVPGDALWRTVREAALEQMLRLNLRDVSIPLLRIVVAGIDYGHGIGDAGKEIRGQIRDALLWNGNYDQTSATNGLANRDRRGALRARIPARPRNCSPRRASSTKRDACRRIGSRLHCRRSNAFIGGVRGK